jgi:hypothetical protein
MPNIKKFPDENLSKVWYSIQRKLDRRRTRWLTKHDDAAYYQMVAYRDALTALEPLGTYNIRIYRRTK